MLTAASAPPPSQDRFDIADIHAALHAAHQGDHTLQTMIFEPRTLRLHVALGRLPSTAGPLRTLEPFVL